MHNNASFLVNFLKKEYSFNYSKLFSQKIVKALKVFFIPERFRVSPAFKHKLPNDISYLRQVTLEEKSERPAYKLILGR